MQREHTKDPCYETCNPTRNAANKSKDDSNNGGSVGNVFRFDWVCSSAKKTNFCKIIMKHAGKDNALRVAFVLRLVRVPGNCSPQRAPTAATIAALPCGRSDIINERNKSTLPSYPGGI